VPWCSEEHLLWWDMDYRCFEFPVVRLLDEEAVLIASYAENEMPYVSLVDLLELPNLTESDKTGESSKEVHFSDNMFVEYHFITRALVCRSATANHLCEELYGLQCIQTLLQD
jgi:hypothetical protein